MLPWYVDGPTPHLILRHMMGFQYGASVEYQLGEIAYLSEGLARLLVKRGFTSCHAVAPDLPPPPWTHSQANLVLVERDQGYGRHLSLVIE